MADHRSVGLAALLAATGGLALATWGYVTRRWRADTPEPGREDNPKHGRTKNPEPIRGENPEPIRGENPEPIRGENPEPIRGENPEPIRGENPEPIRGENPEPILGENPEPILGENPEPVRSVAPEPVRSVAPEPVRSVAPEPGDAVERESLIVKESADKSSVSAATAKQQEMPRPCKQVLVLGLDGSGKTSVLNSILTNRGKQDTMPTEGINAMCINTGGSRMELVEIGGSETLRPYWKKYLPKALAVIFVVDSADHSRLPLAKSHLHQLIQQDSYLPLLVLANKQDLENAYHITEIHEALALSEICEDRKLFLIGTHVTMDDSEISSGIEDTREFLTQLISENAAVTA